MTSQFDYMQYVDYTYFNQMDKNTHIYFELMVLIGKSCDSSTGNFR